MLSNTDITLSSEHMPSDNILRLSELEMKVILILANEGPKSGYDFHLGGKRKRGNRKALMSSGSWPKTKKHLGPGDENLVTKITLKGRLSKDLMGRKKNLFWLTVRGSAYALLNGADGKSVRENALKVYKDEENQKAIKVYFGLREKVGPKVAKVLDKWIVLVGRVEPSGLLLRLLPELLELDIREIAEVFKVAKQYPKYWKLTDEKMEKMGKVIDRLRKE